MEMNNFILFQASIMAHKLQDHYHLNQEVEVPIETF